MKTIKTTGILFLLFVLMSAFTVNKGEIKPVYVMGVSLCFGDSVVYFTDIQQIDSVRLTKEGFLPSREGYSDQLKSYLTEKDYDKFKSTLREMLERYPETDITPTASEIMRQLAKGRKLEGGGSNLRGMFWATRLTNDTIDPNDTSRQVTPFKWEPQAPHYYVFAFSRDSVSENQLLFDIARHNFSTFEIKDFDLEQMSFGNLGLLIIKGFNNFDELVEYKSLLETDDKLHLPQSVRHVMISVDNFNLLVNEGRSLEEYFMYVEQLNQERGDAMMGLGEADEETGGGEITNEIGAETDLSQ